MLSGRLVALTGWYITVRHPDVDSEIIPSLQDRLQTLAEPGGLRRMLAELAPKA